MLIGQQDHSSKEIDPARRLQESMSVLPRPNVRMSGFGRQPKFRSWRAAAPTTLGSNRLQVG
jgi:hypothetical protein